MFVDRSLFQLACRRFGKIMRSFISFDFPTDLIFLIKNRDFLDSSTFLRLLLLLQLLLISFWPFFWFINLRADRGQKKRRLVLMDKPSRRKRFVTTFYDQSFFLRRFKKRAKSLFLCLLLALELEQDNERTNKASRSLPLTSK